MGQEKRAEDQEVDSLSRMAQESADFYESLAAAIQVRERRLPFRTSAVDQLERKRKSRLIRKDGKPCEITTTAERQARAMATDSQARALIHKAAAQTRQKTERLRALRLLREKRDGSETGA